MESSPPHRAWHRPSSPADDSQYSVDLDALELDSPNDTSTPLPQQHVDVVRSEDIDGPSDFTLNMGDWMRGGPLRKGKTGTVNSMQSIPRLEEEQSNTSEQGQSQMDEAQTEVPEEEAEADEDQTTSHHTPINSPPRESVLLSSLHDSNTRLPAPKMMANDASASAGQPRDQLHFLQPTVEDDYSELTPARMASGHLKRPSRGLNSAAQSINGGNMGKGSSDISSSQQEGHADERLPNRNFISQTDEANSQRASIQDEVRMNDLEARCWQLERLNNALNKTVENERALRANDNAMYNAKPQESSHRNSAKADGELDQSKAIDLLEATHAQELQNMRKQMDRDRSEHSHKLRALQQDLDLTRISRDNAEQSARHEREELDELREAHDLELDRVRVQLAKIEELNTQMSELNEQIRTLNLDNADLVAKTREAEDAAANLRAELSVSKQKQDEHLASTTAEQQRAMTRAEDLQIKLDELQGRLESWQTGEDADVEPLQSANNTTDADVDDIRELREQLETRQSELNSALIDRDAVQDSLDSAGFNLKTAVSDLATARAEIESLKLELSDLKTVNLAMDVRISNAIRRREDYWQRTVGEMEKERNLMAKALMNQWGKEEIGPEEPLQGYLYQYLKRQDRSVGTTKSIA